MRTWGRFLIQSLGIEWSSTYRESGISILTKSRFTRLEYCPSFLSNLWKSCTLCQTICESSQAGFLLYDRRYYSLSVDKESLLRSRYPSLEQSSELIESFCFGSLRFARKTLLFKNSSLLNPRHRSLNAIVGNHRKSVSFLGPVKFYTTIRSWVVNSNFQEHNHQNLSYIRSSEMKTHAKWSLVLSILRVVESSICIENRPLDLMLIFL